MRDDVRTTLVEADEALVDSRKAEAERLRSPIDSLRYQRLVLESLRPLEIIDHELSTAQLELAALINLPPGTDLKVAEPGDALNTRIAEEETRKVFFKLFPGISFNYDIKYDTDSYLVHKNWNETGLQISFNLLSAR